MSTTPDENNILQCHSSGAWVTKLEESISQRNLVVTLFYATWSAHSKAMYSHLLDLSKKYPGLMFLKIDGDEVKELTKRIGVRILPTCLIVKMGKEVDRVKYDASLETIEQKIVPHL